MVIPQDTPPTGGNRITASRLAEALTASGVTVGIGVGEPLSGDWDLYHAFNAAKVALSLVAGGIEAERVVVTWTGTDLWQDWERMPERLRQGLDGVAGHVVFTPDARARLLAVAPEWRERIQIIPPGVDTQRHAPGPPAHAWRHPVALLAGGIRPVKRSAWAIELVEAARRQGFGLELIIAGPIRDLEEGLRVQRAARGRPWVALLGEVPAEAMPGWYRSVDLVINTSAVEGVSNALMEAMACGTPVLASDIAGNRSLIEPGVTGLLFSDGSSFVAQVRALLEGIVDGRALGQRARARIVERHSVRAEAASYLAWYRQSLEAVRGCRR